MSLSVYARGNSHPIYDLKVNLESAIRKLEDDSGEDFRALEAKCVRSVLYLEDVADI